MIKRIIFFVTGMLILNLGVTLIIKSNLGTSSWDSVFVGLNKLYGLTVGTWVIVVEVVLIFIISLIEWKKPQLLSCITLIFAGYALDLWLEILLKNSHPTNLFSQWLYLLTGAIMLAFGASVYLQAKFPNVPIDGLMLALHKRFNLSIRLSRITGEISALIIGFLIGGPIGIGTLILTLVTGPLIQLFYKPMEKLYLIFK